MSTANFVEPDVLACGINFGSPPNTAASSSWREVDLTFSALASCDPVAAIGVVPGTLPVRLVVTQALASTEFRQGTLSAVLYTVDGSFGLLGTIDDAVEMTPLSDTPKGDG
jgi:hypothetical protein